MIKKCWARASNFLISRRASAVFIAGVGLSRQPADWVFVAHVGAVVTGARFVELARLYYCVGIELCFRGLIGVGLSSFFICLSGAKENNICFVE